MKRIMILCFSLILLAAGSASAGVLGFGVKGGLNIANIYGDDAEDSNWRNGFVGGVFLDLGITPVFAIQPELLYVQNGSKEDFLGEEIYLNLNYLQVPVLAVVDLPVPGTMIPVLYAGPYLGILIDSELEIKAGDDSATLGLKDYTKSTDTGFVFGAALDFGVGMGKMTIEGRYNLGFTEIDDGIGEAFGDPDPEKSDVKNQSWMIMVGFSF